MKRYIVRYRGTGKPVDSEINRLRSTPGLKIVDASSPHMLLVDATDDGAQHLKEMTSWVATAETFVPVPDTRKKVRGPA